MALFSPSLMAENFTVATEPLQWTGRKPEATRVFRWNGTSTEFFRLLAAMLADQSEAGQIFRRCGATNTSWTGTQTPLQQIADTGLIPEAVDAFNKATATLNSHLVRAQPVLSPIGSAFSVGRVMMGHPKAALYRPKTKLPAKAINLYLDCSASVNAEDIASTMSQIARASWDYQTAGGIVNFTFSDVEVFSRKQAYQSEEIGGLIMTIKVNPASAAAFASIVSCGFWRGVCFHVARALSGAGESEGLPLVQWPGAERYRLAGTRKDHEPILAALKIK